MGNIKTWLVEAQEKYGEPIEAIVVGQHDSTKWESDEKPDENIVLPVELALAKLDQEYDNGFGGADCYPMYAWTKSRVFFIGEYDGATGLSFVPRNPSNVKPEFSGASVD